MINEIEPFEVKDCSLISVSTDKKAGDLRELREGVSSVHPESIYNHFWGSLLRQRSNPPGLGNDFAVWAREGLGDTILSERLALIDPSEFSDAESIRAKLVEVIDEHRTEDNKNPQADLQFHFLRSRIVVFDTPSEALTPQELPTLLPEVSLGTVFYHFIDARWRNPDGVDDFRNWISRFGSHYLSLVRQLASIDSYFVDLGQLKDQLASTVTTYFAKRGV
jgi:hypothetical protein